MKHLKYFEDEEFFKIWRIPTKLPDYYVALKRLGVPQEHRLWYDTNWSDNYTIISTNGVRWYWTTGLKEYEEEEGWQGTVKVTQDDIDNYNAEKEGEKYNILKIACQGISSYI